MTVTILNLDCRTAMSLCMAPGSVDAVITSPPYFGLRDYGHDGQIGLEPTPDEYVAAMVEVFREVRRVLRDDGVVWLNLGDSYARAPARGGSGPNGKHDTIPDYGAARRAVALRSGISNLPNFLTSVLKNQVFFVGSADPRGSTAESIHVLIYDQAAPNHVFEPFFRAQRVCVKEGQYDLGQIGGPLDAPVTCWVSRSLGFGIPHRADAEPTINFAENWSVIVTTGNLDTDPALRSTAVDTIKNGKASFAVEISGKPISESGVDRQAIWNSVTFDTGVKSGPQVDSVNEAVTFADGFDAPAGLVGNLLVRQAADEQFTLDLQSGGQISFGTVTHLSFLSVGRVTPYADALDKATRKRNVNQDKQELGIPEMVKRGLMEDGWICRQTIVWAKPNPMPESVTDRCTKAHEYIFMLTKSPRYYFDAEAVKEPQSVHSKPQKRAARIPDGAASRLRNDEGRFGGGSKVSADGLRNRRSVWTVTTKPYKGAHFATFPLDLIEPCVLASPVAKCGACGAPRKAVRERTDTPDPSYKGSTFSDGKTGAREGGDRTQTGERYLSVVTGYAPSCQCNAPDVPAVMLDPFGGAGTTALAARKHGRDAILCELNADYVALAEARLGES